MTTKYLNNFALFRPPYGLSLLHRPEIQITIYILSQYDIASVFYQLPETSFLCSSDFEHIFYIGPGKAIFICIVVCSQITSTVD